MTFTNEGDSHCIKGHNIKRLISSHIMCDLNTVKLYRYIILVTSIL